MGVDGTKHLKLFMKKIEIKKISGDVIFAYEKESNTIKDTVMEAIKNGADLTGANLKGADLTGADLIGEDLTGADLCCADLMGANLCCADLTDADLTGADLTGADLTGADLRRAELYDAELIRAKFRRADLRRANLTDANLTGADLTGADLTGADLHDANLTDADFRGEDLRDVDIRGAYLGNWGSLSENADIFIAGPIGSRNDYSTFFNTEKGIFVQCGCFKGSLDEFIYNVKETHKDNKHARNYLAIAELVRQKYE